MVEKKPVGIWDREATIESEGDATQGPGSWTALLRFTLIPLGTMALITVAAEPDTPVVLYGWLIVVSGLVEAVHGFYKRRASGFFLHVVPGIAAVPIALLCATHPDTAAAGWMLLFASFLTILGIFEIVAAFRLKFPTWAWTVFAGVVSLLPGTLLWAKWPWDGSRVFGIAPRVALLVRGASTLMFAVGQRRLRTAGQQHLRAA